MVEELEEMVVEFDGRVLRKKKWRCWNWRRVKGLWGGVWLRLTTACLGLLAKVTGKMAPTCGGGD